MANLLTYAKIINKEFNEFAVPFKLCSRSDLVKLSQGTELILPSIHYVGFELTLGYGFYCKTFKLQVSETNPNNICVLAFNSHPTDNVWTTVFLATTTTTCFHSFEATLPDFAQLVYGLRFAYVNLVDDDISITNVECAAVTYPVEYDYYNLDLAAATLTDTTITITNKNIQGQSKNINVVPPFSGNYNQDRVYVVSSAEPQLSNLSNYGHVDLGINIPRDAHWNEGFFYNTVVSGGNLTLSGTTSSGSWVSPVVSVETESMITAYVYTGRETDLAYVEDSLTSVNTELQVRAANQSPLPNFLIVSWAKRLHTFTSETRETPSTLPFVERRSLKGSDSPGPFDPMWYSGYPDCGKVVGVASDPYIYGRSARIYMQGDGSVIAASSPEAWELAARDYWTGVPFKITGDINDEWVAGLYAGLLGDGYYVCGVESAISSYYDHMTIASLADNSLWVEGKAVGPTGAQSLYPLTSHFNTGPLGLAYPLTTRFEYIAQFTIAMPNHPNEWAVIHVSMYPCDSSVKYMTILLLNIRNFWVSESKWLGSFGIGNSPTEEGLAVCDYLGGFWLHVGYSNRRIYKYTYDGELVISYKVARGYSYLRSTKEGLWAITNDSIYYYQENLTNERLEVKFNIIYSKFKFLQAGDVDSSGNLWVVDRDTSTVYCISLAEQKIVYESYIPYVMSVWPHPYDGSAFIYVGFNPSSFSTAIRRIYVNDSSHYQEAITEVPSLPLPDTAGVFFKGKVAATTISPGYDDPLWGAGPLGLEWQPYINGTPTLPAGKYKQFKLTFHNYTSDLPPTVERLLIPKPLVFNQVPFNDNITLFINPHLRYDTQVGKFTTKLMMWWEH